MWTIAITIDNKHIVSGSPDTEIRVWSLVERRQEFVNYGTNGTFALTSDNQFIVVATESRNIELWGIEGKMCSICPGGHTQLFTSISITEDYKYIISSDITRILEFGI